MIGGTAGNDTLYGTSAHDNINALAGDDKVRGLGGWDYVVGGPDDDELHGDGLNAAGQPVGTDGDDFVWGDDGDDVINGGGGIDYLMGGEHTDTLGGDDGNDVIWGDGGDDKLKGGRGHDSFYGGPGHDTVSLTGGIGRDRLYGQAGNDTLTSSGDSGEADRLDCGADYDTAYVDVNDTFAGGSAAAAGLRGRAHPAVTVPARCAGRATMGAGMASAAPARVLVVAHKTAATPALLEAVRARAARSPSAFTLLVPRPYWDPETDEAATTLELALPLLEEAAGGHVDGVIGDNDPFVAVRDALAQLGFDEVIVSTLPARVSRWLRRDLPHRVQSLGVEVTVVTAQQLERAVPDGG